MPQLRIVKKTTETVTPTTEGSTVVTDRVKSDWNDFLGYLDKKGVRGKPELDKGNLGNQYFQQYLKENPNTSLSIEVIPEIRKQYIAERDRGVADIKSGKAKLMDKSGPDVDVTPFMRHIVLNEQSKDPNYVGQHLTQTPFRGTALLSRDTGKVIGQTQFNNPNVGILQSMQNLKNQAQLTSLNK